MQSKVIAKNRVSRGTSNARRLRRSGGLPAVLSHEDGKSQSLELNRHDLAMMLHQHTSENVIVDLEIDGEAIGKVLLKDVQHDPVSGDLLHADLVSISMTEKMRIMIPLTLVGEAPGLMLGGTLEHILREIEVECLPMDLVEEIEVDVSGLQIGDMIHISDIHLGSKFDVLTDAELPVATVAAPRVEEETAEADATGAAAGTEPEVIRAKKDDDESDD